MGYFDDLEGQVRWQQDDAEERKAWEESIYS